MPEKQSARGDGDADAVKACRRFTPEFSRDLPERQYQPRTDGRIRRLAGARFEHLAQRVHALGPRPLAELLAEIATATGQPALIADRLQAYARLDPEIVRALGADKFPPMPLELVK